MVNRCSGSQQRRPRLALMRLVGMLAVVSMPSACAYCIAPVIHEKAIENAGFCAQYVEQGNLTAARARCNIALEYSPKYAEPYNLLGLIEYHLGRADKALEFFKQAISLRSSFAEAYNNMGAVFLDRGDYVQACDRFKEAIEIDPGYLAARTNLANCLFHSDHLDTARDEYLKCVELDPNACACRLGLGSIAIKEQDYAAAKAHFQKMTEICPKSSVAHFNLCWTYFSMHRWADAIDSCMAALALDQDLLEAKQTLVQAQERVALEDAAIEDLKQQIARNPGDPDLHFTLGMVYQDKKLIQYALNEFLNTIKLKPGHLLAHYWAARAYDDQLQATETIAMCESFIDLVRGNEHESQVQWCVSRVKELRYQ